MDVNCHVSIAYEPPIGTGKSSNAAWRQNGGADETVAESRLGLCCTNGIYLSAFSL